MNRWVAPAALIAVGSAALLYARRASAKVGSFGPSPRTSTGGRGDNASGLLLQAVKSGTIEPIRWAKIPMGDLTLTVAADALRAPVGGDSLRLFASWPETIEICREIAKDSGGCIAPSKQIADAIYATAPTKTAFHSLVRPDDPESGGAKMHTIDFVKKYNADVDAQIAAKRGGDGLVSGHEKYWILHPRLSETVRSTGRPAAINYGAWDASGNVLQSPGGRHDIEYVGDYSQLVRPVQ